MPIKSETKLRFEDKIETEPNTGCHIWTGYLNPNGYGNFRLGERSMLSHRVSWLLIHDSIPDGMIVCHSCDNPWCVNVDHLFLGTQSDNLKDMSKKNRGSKSKNGMPKWITLNRGKYVVQRRFNGKMKNYGRKGTMNEAIELANSLEVN